jgi:hypothetical protein
MAALVDIRTITRTTIAKYLTCQVPLDHAAGWDDHQGRLGVLPRGAFAPKSQHAAPLLTSEFVLDALAGTRSGGRGWPSNR